MLTVKNCFDFTSFDSFTFELDTAIDGKSIDNPPLIGYNTLVTWFEKIVKFDFVQIMTLVRVIRSDFSFKGRNPAFLRFRVASNARKLNSVITR